MGITNADIFRNHKTIMALKYGLIVGKLRIAHSNETSGEREGPS